MTLATITDKITIELTSAVTTTDMDFVLAYRDDSTTAITPYSSVGSTNGTTVVDVLGSPSSGHKYIVDYFSLINNDSIAKTVIIRLKAGGVTKIVYKGILDIGVQVQYVREKGFTESLVVGGMSAYEVAVANGYVGSEASWLASLVGADGTDGIDGTNGTDGTDGVGVPAGGTDGQILAKIDGTDYNTEWIDAPSSGGGVGSASDTELLYNNGGAVDGITDIYSDGTQILRLSDDSPLVFDYDTRGGNVDTKSRIDVIGSFASPNAGGLISGEYYDNAFHANTTTTRTGVNNDMELIDFFTSEDMDVEFLGLAISTGAASSEMKILVYASGSDGWPDAKLKETAAIATTSGGYKYEFQSPVLTLKAGVKYWIGWRFNGAPIPRVNALASAVNLGPAGSTANTYYTILRRSLAFATAAPSNWGFTPSDRVANVTPPLIRFKQA